MFAAGAPRSYSLVNAAALALGVLTASLVRRTPARNSRFVGLSTVAIGLALLATALFGIHIEGASRWVALGGMSVQPSLILLPPAILLFAKSRDWVSSIGLVIASIGLGTQPDRAMAGTLAAGLAVVWLRRRELPVTVAFAAAICALVATLLSADVVAPVPFVEQVLQSAFAFHALTGLAVVVGLATLLVPTAAGLQAPTDEREIFPVFGATWLTMIVFAIAGNYPTPLVGYGSSAILGYCLSAGALTRPVKSRRTKTKKAASAHS